ncbi:UNVERIFIED_CONTAM: hypothetical protein FKN15_074470 [Acipenser sinensis]
MCVYIVTTSGGLAAPLRSSEDLCDGQVTGALWARGEGYREVSANQILRREREQKGDGVTIPEVITLMLSVTWQSRIGRKAFALTVEGGVTEGISVLQSAIAACSDVMVFVLSLLK